MPIKSYREMWLEGMRLRYPPAPEWYKPGMLLGVLSYPPAPEWWKPLGASNIENRSRIIPKSDDKA